MRFYCSLLFCLLLPALGAEEGHFCGGSLSFSFMNETTGRIRSLLGWDLGFGPCGSGCDATKIDTSTKASRAQIYKTKGMDYLGNWTMEVKGKGDDVDITSAVTTQFEGRISGVNEHLKWELEYGEFYIDFDPNTLQEDVKFEGSYWKPLNSYQPSKGDEKHSRYHLQIKIHGGRRNDTGKTNNSPIALFKPLYSIKLNTVTEIKLATMDADGDVVYCGDAKYVEAGDLKQMKGVHIQEKNCSIFIDASVTNGFKDDGMAAVLVKVMDYNHKPIKINLEPDRVRTPFELPISDIPVQFLVHTLEVLLDPRFVPPTPDDHQKFEVYAGVHLEIAFYAQPHVNSTHTIEAIPVTCLQRMNIPLTNLADDPKRMSERVKYRMLSWDTTLNDIGTYMVQATSLDTGGIDGKERNVIIVIKDANLTRVKTATAEDLSPLQGTFTCLENNTCTIPVIFSPGQSIKSVTVDSSTLPGVALSPLRKDNTSVFKTEFKVLGSKPGNQSVCLKVHGMISELVSCCVLLVIPPDPCLRQPCKYGTCFANWDKYTCVCKAGYTGGNCDAAIDFCDPPPCGAGTCTSLGAFAPMPYYCSCPDGTVGVPSCPEKTTTAESTTPTSSITGSTSITSTPISTQTTILTKITTPSTTTTTPAATHSTATTTTATTTVTTTSQTTETTSSEPTNASIAPTSTTAIPSTSTTIVTTTTTTTSSTTETTSTVPQTTATSLTTSISTTTKSASSTTTLITPSTIITSVTTPTSTTTTSSTKIPTTTMTKPLTTTEITTTSASESTLPSAATPTRVPKTSSAATVQTARTTATETTSSTTFPTVTTTSVKTTTPSPPAPTDIISTTDVSKTKSSTNDMVTSTTPSSTQTSQTTQTTSLATQSITTGATLTTIATTGISKVSYSASITSSTTNPKSSKNDSSASTIISSTTVTDSGSATTPSPHSSVSTARTSLSDNKSSITDVTSTAVSEQYSKITRPSTTSKATVSVNEFKSSVVSISETSKDIAAGMSLESTTENTVKAVTSVSKSSVSITVPSSTEASSGTVITKTSPGVPSELASSTATNSPQSSSSSSNGQSSPASSVESSSSTGQSSPASSVGSSSFIGQSSPASSVGSSSSTGQSRPASSVGSSSSTGQSSPASSVGSSSSTGQSSPASSVGSSSFTGQSSPASSVGSSSSTGQSSPASSVGSSSSTGQSSPASSVGSSSSTGQSSPASSFGSKSSTGQSSPASSVGSSGSTGQSSPASSVGSSSSTGQSSTSSSVGSSGSTGQSVPASSVGSPTRPSGSMGQPSPGTSPRPSVTTDMCRDADIKIAVKAASDGQVTCSCHDPVKKKHVKVIQPSPQATNKQLVAACGAGFGAGSCIIIITGVVYLAVQKMKKMKNPQKVKKSASPQTIPSSTRSLLGSPKPVSPSHPNVDNL